MEEQKQPMRPTTTSPFEADAAMTLALSKKQNAEQQKKSKLRLRDNKKRNNGKARKSREPEVKVFVEPRDADAIRVGEAVPSIIPGNMKHRDHVDDNDGTTTDHRLYVVTNIVARRKALQALRKHMTLEGRILAAKQQKS